MDLNPVDQAYNRAGIKYRFSTQFFQLTGVNLDTLWGGTFTVVPVVGSTLNYLLPAFPREVDSIFIEFMISANFNVVNGAVGQPPYLTLPTRIFEFGGLSGGFGTPFQYDGIPIPEIFIPGAAKYMRKTQLNRISIADYYIHCAANGADYQPTINFSPRTAGPHVVESKLQVVVNARFK